MAILRNPPLEERIKTIRAEIETFIDAKAAHVKETCEGVPIEVIRNLITAKGGYCECRQYIAIKKQDEIDGTT